MKVLAVIPARGGSKGLPRKNILEVAGKPLIQWTIDAARESTVPLRVVVSTDDEEIAETSRQGGAEVPFLRPSKLATDDASSYAVVRHAVETLESADGEKFDLVVLLQPTSPLRTSDDIGTAIRMLAGSDYSAVISVVEVTHAHPMLLKTVEDGVLRPYLPDYPEGARRQDLKPNVFTTNGAIYVSKRETVMDGGSLLGDKVAPYLMPEDRSLDIDTRFDLELASFILGNRGREGE